MPMERVVRPFETGDVSPPRLTTGNDQTRSLDIIRLKIGIRNKGKLLNESQSGSTQFYVDHKQKEEQTP